jgi:hypothetical protein
MNKEQVKNIFAIIKAYSGILIRGMVRIIYGAAVAGMFAMSAYGFFSISSEDGWAAVCDFIATLAMLVIAFANVYVIGGGACKRVRKNG